MKSPILHLFAVLTSLSTAATLAAAEPAKARLVADPSGGSLEVSVSMKLEGELAGEAKQVDQPSPKTPIALSVELAYEQRPSGPASYNLGSETPAVIRRYKTAEMKAGKNTVALRPECGDLLTALGAGRIHAESTQSPLTRQELELVEFPADPLTTGLLLPEGEVLEGDTWELGPEKLGPLLKLDQVSLCEAEAVLTDLNKSYARLKFGGTVRGVADGAVTDINVQGIALFDRRKNLMIKLNVGLKEIREIGPATPGLEVSAKINVTCKTIDRTNAEPWSVDRSTALLSLASKDGAWQTLHDRGWRRVASGSGVETLRLVQGREPVAELKIRTLPPQNAESFDTEAFANEVKDESSRRGGRMISSTRWTNAAGLLCQCLTTQSVREGEMVVRRYYQAISPEGRRAVSATAELNAANAKNLADADRRVIEALVFLEESPRTAKRSTATKR